ncbi:zinc transport system substrate-binding protein [Anaerosporobacter mobilis DSM 15930]|uniref:Zinc transport system substrate-binding protein n=1 Tax=Anaerosporobacter mobilis DSM 15930 TaxID=1120996 RepID=A0A1M7IW54_9FIRM|nr:zinc transport system substrate-binding protein [Anaerosporobacter mobilis DSM 15930]
MKRYRKLQVIICVACIVSLLLIGCSKVETTDSKVAGDNTSKIKVVTTLFPQYDFANQVGKDAVEVKMLLKPGVESHTYEPAPSDIIEINKADIFLYTGDEMEPWVSKILDSLDSDVMIIDLSKNITLDKVGDHDHEHEDEESDGDHLHEDESEEAEHEEDHVHSYDPHIWTNPLNAKIMVEDIKTALSEVDKANKMTYENNAKDYLASLDQLDQDIREVVKQAKRDEVVFGGRFAFHYFFEEYGLDYVSAYDSCSSETEPSAKVIATIIDKVKEDQIPVIFYEEFANPKVAESIANATGAKTLLLHSCHNVSTDDYKNGATYLSLMYQNLENLKEALN